MGKRIKLTEKQLEQIVSRVNEIANIGPSTPQSKSQVRSFKQGINSGGGMKEKVHFKEDTDLGEHPVMGTDYDPQTEKENEKTTNSFSKPAKIREGKSNNPFPLRDLGEEIKKTLISIATNKKLDGIGVMFKKLGLTLDELLASMSEYGLIKYEDGKIEGVNSSNVKRNIKRLALHLKNEKELVRPEANVEEASDYVPDPSDFLHQAPFNAPSLTSKPKHVEYGEYHTIYMNPEIVIMRSKADELFVFYYASTNKEDFHQYAEIPMDHVGKDEDGNPDFDYKYDEMELDGGVIDRYVNDNITSISKGSGVESFEDGDDLVRIDPALAQELVRTYKSDKLGKILGINMQTENTVAGSAGMGGSSGPFVGPIGGSPVIKRPVAGVVGEGKKMIKKDGSAVKMRRKKYHYQKADSKTRKCSLCEYYNKGKCKKIWGVVESNYVCDAFENKEVDENTTTASVGGNTIVTPKMWAKDNKNWKNSKKTMYPGGSIIQKLQELMETKGVNVTDTAYPAGGFVELDDCTKLNNNKEAQNGGCSVGAVDKVVKTRTTKSSVISPSLSKTQ